MRAETRSSSDPLPFTQLDRTARARAATLAGPLGVSHQHALGSLVWFWDLCGEPRELERLLAQGVDRVIVSAEVVERRLKLAFGQQVDPALLVDAGLLEAVGADQYRIRGMSRFFDAIKTRLEARAKGARGGKASAAARQAKNGTARPSRTTPEQTHVGSGPASIQLKHQVEQVVEPTRSSGSSRTEAAAQADAKQNEPEDRGQRSETVTDLLLQAPEAEKSPSHDPLPAEAFARRAQDRRVELGYVEERPDEFAKGLGPWFSEAMLKLNGDQGRLWQAFEEFLLDPYWVGRKCPFAAFRKRWETWVPKKLRHVDRPTADTPEAQAWAQKLAELTAAGHAYEASKLASLEPLGIDSGRIVVESPDPYFVNWCRGVIGELPELAGVWVVAAESQPAEVSP